MKRIFLIAGSLLLLVGGFTVFYGFTPKIEKEIAAGLENGDSEKVAAFFVPEVEIEVPGFEDIIPKKEAEEKLSEFFQNYIPVTFNRIHGGESKNKTSNFLIGKLETETGNFRVSIFLKYGMIEQLSIVEKEPVQ